MLCWLSSLTLCKNTGCLVDNWLPWILPGPSELRKCSSGDHRRRCTPCHPLMGRTAAVCNLFPMFMAVVGRIKDGVLLGMKGNIMYPRLHPVWKRYLAFRFPYSINTDDIDTTNHPHPAASIRNTLLLYPALTLYGSNLGPDADARHLVSVYLIGKIRSYTSSSRAA